MYRKILSQIFITVFITFIYAEEIVLQNGTNDYSGCIDSHIEHDGYDSSVMDENFGSADSIVTMKCHT